MATLQSIFPPTYLADEDGRLATGGTITENTILQAYHKGIFPWYEGSTPQWYAPNPRFVLYPNQLKVSKSMQQIIRKNHFQFSWNTAFSDVIQCCEQIPRQGQYGTWINSDIITTYTALHHKGWAFSAETWLEGDLVGGLYGLQIGSVFCGESMFSLVSNASKFAFIKAVEHLKNKGVTLIDCQVYTPHLESLGAVHIPRTKFEEYLPTYAAPTI
ncbi:MAG: leucyl/phenylalanyl-tRNA--protein transferase [Bacteroidetes bacterium]|nr:MAG: leucyl/phenylalanyl-tRNA--protein transferase [Bacteroidota bacterium]TAE67623.1 MAG: leucyl/phenylalanyl-tRNA--protein transferase [Bacteroidota bacterium]TAF93692.1 MAG: leucyl/phenylalanyl-tRNA--protein transferase [Bacteroidota bacterium]